MVVTTTMTSWRPGGYLERSEISSYKLCSGRLAGTRSVHLADVVDSVSKDHTARVQSHLPGSHRHRDPSSLIEIVGKTFTSLVGDLLTLVDQINPVLVSPVVSSMKVNEKDKHGEQHIQH